MPEFLFKRDVIPYGTAEQQKQSGLRDNRFEFTATTTGSFVGRCAELCGTYHSQMNFEVRVVSPNVYRDYLAQLKRIGPERSGPAVESADRRARPGRRVRDDDAPVPDPPHRRLRHGGLR